MKSELTLVLPCYNPPSGWADIVLEGYKEIQSYVDYPVELIIVNDGSTQHIEASIVHKLQNQIPLFKFISYPANRGKGFALRKGMKEVQTQTVIYTDIDFPYTSESLLSMLRELQSGTEIAIGVKNKTYYKNVPFVRVLISKILRKLIGFSLSIPITDTQCGLKGFHQKGKEVFLGTTIDRYLFDLEFVYNSFRQKPPLSIRPISITLKPGVKFRRINAKILWTELRNFLKILKRNYE